MAMGVYVGGIWCLAAFPQISLQVLTQKVSENWDQTNRKPNYTCFKTCEKPTKPMRSPLTSFGCLYIPLTEVCDDLRTFANFYAFAKSLQRSIQMVRRFRLRLQRFCFQSRVGGETLISKRSALKGTARSVFDGICCLWKPQVFWTQLTVNGVNPPTTTHTHTRWAPTRAHTCASSWVYKNRPWRLGFANLEVAGTLGRMPASQVGFGNFFLDRSVNMPSGYQIPLLGGPPCVQQQPQLAAVAAGIPVPFSGLQGYSFIPYAHHRHMTHMVRRHFSPQNKK